MDEKWSELGIRKAGVVGDPRDVARSEGADEHVDGESPEHFTSGHGMSRRRNPGFGYGSPVVEEGLCHPCGVAAPELWCDPRVGRVLEHPADLPVLDLPADLATELEVEAFVVDRTQNLTSSLPVDHPE